MELKITKNDLDKIILRIIKNYRNKVKKTIYYVYKISSIKMYTSMANIVRLSDIKSAGRGI